MAYENLKILITCQSDHGFMIKSLRFCFEVFIIRRYLTRSKQLSCVEFQRRPKFPMKDTLSGIIPYIVTRDFETMWKPCVSSRGKGNMLNPWLEYLTVNLAATNLDFSSHQVTVEKSNHISKPKTPVQKPMQGGSGRCSKCT